MNTNPLASFIADTPRFQSGIRLLQKAPAAFYHDPAASIWVMQMGVDYPGRSVYFASTNGKKFSELIEITSRHTNRGRVISLEAVGTGRFRLEREEERANLFHETDAGEKLIAGALGRIAPEQTVELLKRSAFHMIKDIGERVRGGDANAILAYGASNKLLKYFDCSPCYIRSIDIDSEGISSLVRRCKDDERAFLALCILAGNYVKNAHEALLGFDCEKLLSAAHHYEAPRRIILERAKNGSSEAVKALRGLALESKEGLVDLLNLYRSSATEKITEVLRTFPIEGRELRPSQLEVFAQAGHPDARHLLDGYDPEGLIASAQGVSCAFHLMNSREVSELAILVRFNNQRALDGLFALYADGHPAAREAIKQLVAENIMRPGVLTNVDLEPLAAKAAKDPMSVIALHRFHQDGHPNARELLANLSPVDELLTKASRSYDAVLAILFLGQAGNTAIHEGINTVSIDKWRKDYELSGRAKIEGREARAAMSYLAELGNAEAAAHEGKAIPQRAMAALQTLSTLAEIAKTTPVKIVSASPPAPAKTSDFSSKIKTGPDRDDKLLH